MPFTKLFHSNRKNAYLGLQKDACTSKYRQFQTKSQKLIIKQKNTLPQDIRTWELSIRNGIKTSTLILGVSLFHFASVIITIIVLVFPIITVFNFIAIVTLYSNFNVSLLLI